MYILKLLSTVVICVFVLTVFAREPMDVHGNPLSGDNHELKKIMAGTADYCKRLKKTAFHFICKEKVLEIKNEGLPPWPIRGVVARTGIKEKKSNLPGQVDEYLFHYRLIKEKGKIREERELIKPKKYKSGDKSKFAGLTRFFSKRAVFAANTIFSADRQHKYNYRLIKYDSIKGRRTAVVEVIPKNKENIVSIYGKVWIDMDDYAVIKLEADPPSVIGYKTFLEIAEKINADLHLKFIVEFNQVHQGIHFPTKISISEKYRKNLPQLLKKVWERSRTVFTYLDYRFFYVKTEVTEEEMDLTKD